MSELIVPRGPLRGHAHYLEHVASAGGPGWDLAAILVGVLALAAFAQLLR